MQPLIQHICSQINGFIFLKGSEISLETKSVSRVNTACPREIVPRGGHPLGLIDYVIERVYQVFLPFELHKFGIFWNLHQPKGVPSPRFHQPKGFWKVALP
jgi:hypothetical protein